MAEKKGVKERICVVVPAYNEERSISKVLDDLKKEGYSNIVVIDDGSKDRTYQIAASKGVYVYHHSVNRGLGGALGTGIEAGLLLSPDVIVTFDADGQHLAKDVIRVAAPILNGQADAVIGSRMLDKKLMKEMPFIRRVGNKGFNVITKILFGVRTTDSQSGLRAFSRKAASRIHIMTNRMEVSSEFIKEIGAHHLRFREVAIRPVYTTYSMEKGQSNLNAFKILVKLILKKIMQ